MSDSFTAPSRGGNYIHGLLAFVERWHTRAEQTLPPSGALITGEAGNINIDGRPESHESLVMTRWHAEFAESLEPGVRELVLKLVSAWNCITYSSCEGHPTTPASGRRHRHVCILPRSATEYAALLAALTSLARTANADAGSSGARAKVLQCIVTGDGLEAPSLDLVFSSREGDDDDAYFADLEALYDAVLRALDTGTAYQAQ